MSWFNETFTDSFNSLKGQITKITKEVLAEDDNESEENVESIRLQLKELDALCSSKDIELASLREENIKIVKRFQEELKILKDENKRLKSSAWDKSEGDFFENDQSRKICDLENELYQLRIERDHLEELQRDHQSNICLVVQQRDSSKSELENMKADYSNLKSKFEELQNSKIDNEVASAFSEVNLLDDQSNYDELIDLRESVEKLQSEIDLYQRDKEDSSKLIHQIRLENKDMKEKIDKLVEEIKVISGEKDDIELENCRLKETIHSVKCELETKSHDLEEQQEKLFELEDKIKKLTESQENSNEEQLNFQRDLDSQVNQLLDIFNISNKNNMSLSSVINEIDILWKKNLKEKENSEKICSENLNKIQNEVQRLKNDKISLEHEIKVGLEKRNELESDYKKEINSLQNKYFQLKSQEQDCLIKSQTDDVKRLDQEVTKLMETVELKNKELGECYNKINTVTQELNAVKSLTTNSEQELLKVTAAKEELEKSLIDLKSNINDKEKEIAEIKENECKNSEMCAVLQNEKTVLLQQNENLQTAINEATKLNKDLETKISSLQDVTGKVASLEKELEEVTKSKCELEKTLMNMQEVKLNSDKQTEYLKAQLIIKENSISELSAKNRNLTDDVNKLKEESAKLHSTEEELRKWKEEMIVLEMQRQELSEQKDLLEKECATLGSELMAAKQREGELEYVKRENANLIETCNKLQNEVQIKQQSEEVNQEESDIASKNQELLSSAQAEIQKLTVFAQQQETVIASLSYENNQLKNHTQLLTQNLQALSEENNQLRQARSIEAVPEDGNCVNMQNQISRDKLNVVQQHRRSKSDFDATNAEEADLNKLRLEVESLRESLQRQQKEYASLREQHALIVEKEAHSKKELERLRLHLIEVENSYTEIIDEYKTKLNVTEEQLKNSSTVYTSTKVRDNQHLESLQSQLRLISAQRDDLQVKLSAAEDEVQKHKAALTSFHVVLEQFQQDKERELENIAAKHQNQMALSERRFSELQQEINSLNNQLSDAKTGLKAASRLGEQLERKTEQIIELERRLADTKNEMKELEEQAALANQSNFGKVDKSLVKNLLLGYISAQKGDRKTQVLRILMSVLDFDEEERNKIGLDNSQSGWLSHLLHPRGDAAQTSQSLSEAFIRFLENESRPQPQLKLLPERSPQIEKSQNSAGKPQPSLLLQELVLPTFSSPQTSESTILKDVLSDT